ncbi:MAG: hypothetical protein SFY32_13070 [Bacteroidota bacterium]|nr:hypothetical protein [Bacteroidota bacterium]
MNELPKPSEFNKSPLSTGEGPGVRLTKLLTTREKLLKAKSQKIHFAPAILFQNENPVFFPKTINIIQGKAGVHKSRLAETICASLLKRPGTNRDLLGFNAQTLTSFNVCYIDTERNLSDQLPYALQQIQLKAGYNMEDRVPNFDCVSLLEFSREERFEVVDEYLEHIRNTSKIHTFIVLDVITDCVFNFNDARDSMRLIDMMNRSINKYDITFLCLIHENPGSIDKARGHLGTELTNKASTVIQVAHEDNDSEGRIIPSLIKISYLKCRSTARHEPFFAEYSETEKGLVLADESNHPDLSKKEKAGLKSMLEMLGILLQEPMSRKELTAQLADEFFCTSRTIISRLDEITTNAYTFQDYEGRTVALAKQPKGKEIIYSLHIVQN